MSRNLWSEEELILTLAVYFQLPFGRLNFGTPEVIELASYLNNRNANSAAMRLNNFAACDPSIAGTIGPNGHIRKGLEGGKDKCLPIWNKYKDNREALFEEAAKIRARIKNIKVEQTLTAEDQVEVAKLTGRTREQLVKTRINQDAFRKMILNNYDNKCAITGIDIPQLLIASHIVPWAANTSTRLDPENGICLSALYDKAFDRGLISFTSDYKVLLSERIEKEVKKEYYSQYFLPIKGQPLWLPYDHKPNKEYLEYHRDVIFEKL